MAFTPRIRPIYGDDEVNPGEQLSRGVAGGIQALLDEVDRRKQEGEADRREQNTLTQSGYTAVPAGRPPMAPARMAVGAPGAPNAAALAPAGAGPGIGQAINWHLEQQNPDAGYETSRTRTGQVFRRPGAEMRATSAAQAGLASKRAESDIEVGEYQRKEGIRETTERNLIPLRNQNPSRITFEQRKELANITAGSRAAATAATTNRGNSSVQLQALTQYQTSLDRKVTELRTLIKDARDKYRDDDATEYSKLLSEAMDAADENREALKRLSSGGGRPALNRRPTPAAPARPAGGAPPAPARSVSPFAARRPIVVPPPVKP